MKNVLLAVVIASLATPAYSQAAKTPNRSVAARTALCKADCRPGNYQATGVGMHGLYRSYNQFDPQLKSIEGQKQFAECVKHCSDPLPEVYVQRPIFAMGMNWFGKSATSCLDCHANKEVGRNSRRAKAH